MQLDLKTQQLKPENKINKREIATAISLDPQTPEQKDRRGTLFCTLEIKSEKDTDLKTLTVLFADTLKGEYFKQNNDTPLYAIEHALEKAKQNTISFEDEKNNIQISFCAALIWNRVLYITHTGAPAAYIIRNSGVKDFAPAPSQNELITMSGLIASDDVIIIGTNAFRKNFPPQKILNNLGGLSNAIANTNNANIIATILIKATTPAKKQRKISTQRFINPKIAGTITSRLIKLKNRLFEKKSLSETYKEYQAKKPAPVASISATTNNSATITTNTVGISQKRKRLIKNNKKRKRSITIGLLFLTLIALGGLTAKKQNTKITKNEIDSILSANITNKKNSSVLGATTSTNSFKLTKINKNFETMAGALYKENNIVILNSRDNTIYLIDTKTKTYKKILDGFSNPKYLNCNRDLCFVVDEDLIKVFKINKPDDINSYSHNIKDIQGLTESDNKVFLLTNSNIFALKLGNKNNKPTKWLDDKEKLINPISITYQTNTIFILGGETNKGRNISKYISDGKIGIKKSFKIENSYLLTPKQITSNKDYLFVLNSDKNESSVVIFDNKTGKFIRKVVLTKNEVNSNIPLIIPGMKGLTFYYIKNNVLYESSNQ